MSYYSNIGFNSGLQQSRFYCSSLYEECINAPSSSIRMKDRMTSLGHFIFLPQYKAL